MGLLTLSLWGCEKDRPEQPYLQLEKAELSIPSEAGSHKVGIKTNVGKLELSVQGAKATDWLAVKLGDNQIAIEAKENLTTEPRKAEVVVTGEGLSAKLQLTQLASPAFITSAKSSVAFAAEGGSETIAIESNVTWEVEKPETATWLTIDKEEKAIKLTAQPFKKDETRTATLLLKGASVETKVEVSQKGEAQYLGISLPKESDFNESKVLAVFDGEVQIAEICREYLNIRGDGGINRVETVIYPVVEGKADLSKGILMSNGAKVAWDFETNRATLTPVTPEVAPTKLYFDGENLLLENPNNVKVVEATVKPSLLNDVRPGAATLTYPIVKVGTQYWMGKNLKTKHYQDGTEIVFKTIDEKWSTTEGAYCYPEGQIESANLFGYWYNGHAVLHEKGLAPKGWKVPHNDDFTKLKSYLGSNAGTKAKSRTLWQDETPTNTTNLSGLDILAAGYRAEGATQYMIGVRSYHWTSVKAKDLLFKTEGLNFIMLNTGKSTFYNTYSSQIHNLEAGHSVICLREE